MPEASLLRNCGGLKLKGVPVRELFTYTVTNAFRMGSFYMQQKVGTIREEFSKNTYYRFLANHRIIEVFFKTCKSSLLLGNEYHGLSYDGLTAHVAMVFTRYMLLAVSKRDNEDDRTLGALFYLMVSEVADITYHESMMIIVETMLATVQEEFHITDEQIECFYNKFMSKLPESMQRLLQAN